jgi:RNA-directed DNA polymerase
MTSEERREARYQRRKAKRQEALALRSQNCGDFEEVFSFRHLYLSGKKCCKNVYWKNSTQRFVGNIIPNVAKIHRGLIDGTFKHKGFHQFDLIERGKKRHIRSVHISERTVQKCLCDYCIVPIFSASFIYDNAASLKYRGMDFALRRLVCQLQKHYRKYGLKGGVLLYDFHSFFDTAPHAPLFSESLKRIHDPRTREVADSFIKDFGAVGLGLGSQVSQTNALMLPNRLDHYCKENLRFRAYGRYMDDGWAIHENIAYLRACMPLMKMVCDEIGLTFNEKKTRVVPMSEFRILKTKFITTESGEIVLKMNRDSTTIMRRKLRAFKKWCDAGTFTIADVRSAYESYQGHMKRGNSFKVRQTTDHYFEEVFGFYPNKKGWSTHV